MKYKLLSLLLLSLLLFSCKFSSYSTPGVPNPPLETPRAIASPDSIRSDTLFNGYSYIHVEDEGNSTKIISLSGPSSSATVGSFLQYQILNNEVLNTLTITIDWGSYRKLNGNDIDLYSDTTFTNTFASSSLPFSSRYGSTARDNSDPANHSYAYMGTFTMQEVDEHTILFGKKDSSLKSFQMMNDYMGNLFFGGTPGSPSEQLAFAYLPIYITQTLIPGFAGAGRYTYMSAKILALGLEDDLGKESLSEILNDDFDSLYGSTGFSDSFLPPLDNPLVSSNSSLTLNNGYQVFSQLLVDGSYDNSIYSFLSLDGSGKLWGGVSYLAEMTGQADPVSLILFLGDNGMRSRDYYKISESIFNDFNGSSSIDTLTVTTGNVTSTVMQSDDGVLSLNPGEFKLKVTP